MQLSDEQVARFRRDGFLLFPGLFSKAEIAVLRAETARLAKIEADTVIRERTGGVRSIFRVHEDDGATRSAAFRALVRTPRVLKPTMQALNTGGVYVYHTKINTKPAIEGTVWMWHQDYGSGEAHRCAPRATTSPPRIAGTSTSRSTPAPTRRSSAPARVPTGWFRETPRRFPSRATTPS